MSEIPVGKVLGTEDASPLEFWVALSGESVVQLDDVVLTKRRLPSGEQVALFGVVTDVRARQEGARFDSDVFLIEQGVLPGEVVQLARIATTRVEPEIFVPPLPGQEAYKAYSQEREQGLFFDGMKRRFACGLNRDGEPIFLNLDFLDGTKGAHVNISGISGVATKTSYAIFLLYSLFGSGILGSEASNTKALIFNVKGEDLLFLDVPNAELKDRDRDRYRKLGLEPAAFPSTAFLVPPKHSDPDAAPDVSRRAGPVTSFFWTLEEFCHNELLPFLFADAEDERQQYTMVVHNVTAKLKQAERAGEGAVVIDGRKLSTFPDLVDLISDKVSNDDDQEAWAGRAIGQGTINAFIRRLHGTTRALSRLIRGDVPDASKHQVSLEGAQVNVVDIHNLPDRAKRFVVGVILKRQLERKEKQGTSKPLTFVVLDELNKYAPREGSSPIKEIFLDIAERGRSLGLILIGAEQSASEVEPRIVSQCAIRVAGRLDAAEAEREQYGFLRGPGRDRATIMKPGTMFLSQPEIPLPLMLEFPFPSWATRPEEQAPSPHEGDDIFARFEVQP